MMRQQKVDRCDAGLQPAFKMRGVLKRTLGVLVLVGFCFLAACQKKPASTAVPTAPPPTPTPTVEVLLTATAVPIQPLPADFWALPAQALLIQDDLAYVAAGEAGLHVFDMTTPDEPTAVAYFDIEAGEVVADGDALYVVGCHRQCIYTIDLSGDVPKLLEDVFQAGVNPIRALTVENGVMYLAVESGLIGLVDLGVRPWPLISSHQMPGEIADLDSQYDFLYVTLPQGVYLFDVTDPAAMKEQDFYPAPKPMWHEETAGVVYDTAVDGEQAYVAADSKGLRVLDHFVESEDRQTVDFWDDSFYHVRGQATAVNWQPPLFYVKSWDAETGEYYLTILRHLAEGGSYIPINLIGEYAVGEDDLGRMVVWNGRVYFVNEGITEFHLPDGYEELTGTHPVSPTVIGPPTPEVQFVRQMGGSQFSLALQENIAYVGSGKTLHIYDVTNPAVPVELNTLSFSEDINEIKVHNGYAYLRMEGFEWGYLLVLDISDPVNPVEESKASYFVQDMEFTGDQAYIISGYYDAYTALNILDISDPANIQELGSFTSTLRDDAGTEEGHSVAGANQYRMLDLAVSGDYAYIAWGDDWSCRTIDCAGGLLILDVSDKTNPIESGVFLLGGMMTSVATSGDTVFGVDEVGQLLAFDVSDKQNPTVISILEAGLDGLFEEKMVVAEDELWVADGRNGLRRFDTTNLSWITEKSGYQTDAIVQMLAMQNDLVYLVSGGAGLEILQKDSTDELVALTAVQPIPNATDIVVQESVAYIADNERGLTVWDLTDPVNPTRLGNLIQGSQYPEELTLAADKLYARSVNLSAPDDYFNRRSTVDVFDISQPLTPTYQLTLPFEVQTFAMYDGRAYITNNNQLTIWNMTNLESPELLGTYEASDWLRGQAVAFGDVVYISVAGRVLLVLDASDPANIRPIHSIEEVQGLRPIMFGSWDLKIADDRLYSICDWSGLCIYDITEPAHPVFLQVIPGIVHDLAIIDDVVYSLLETSQETYELTLKAYDVSDPAYIKQLTDFPDDFEFSYEWPGGLAVAYRGVYAALGSNGLVIFEHNPNLNNE